MPNLIRMPQLKDYDDYFEFVSDTKVAKARNAFSANTLRRLAQDESLRVKATVALNPHTPPDVLRELSTEMSMGVRRGVASNLSTPSDVLSHLAKHHYTLVRLDVAENLNTPTRSLIHLTADKDERVRVAAEARVATFSPETLSELVDLTLCELGVLLDAPRAHRADIIRAFMGE